MTKFLACALLFVSNAASANPPVTSLDARVAAAASDAMKRTGAQGIAIATIANGQVQSVQAFGKRNAKGDPLTPDTIMYGASLTKAVFGYYAAQLAAEASSISMHRSAPCYRSLSPHLEILTLMAIGVISKGMSGGGRSPLGLS